LDFKPIPLNYNNIINKIYKTLSKKMAGVVVKNNLESVKNLEIKRTEFIRPLPFLLRVKSLF